MQQAGYRSAILLGVLLAGLAAAAQTPTRTVPPGVAPESFLAAGDSVRGRILVPVHFGNLGPYPFLLDLSIRHPVVDARLAANIGLPRAGLEEDSGETPLYLLRAMRCGTLPPREALVAGVDLSGLAARAGRPVAGLWPAHQPGFEVEIDVASAEVRWHDFGASTLMEDGDAIPMTIGENGAPRVNVLLMDRVEHPLALDLSVGERIELSDSLLRSLGVLKAETPRLVLPDAEDPVTQCRLPLLRAGGTEFSSVLCTVAADSEGSRMGLGLLHHFKIRLNYEFGLIRFTSLRGDAVSDPPLTGFGLVLDTFRGGFWTVRVAEASPAHRAGLRSGDHLVGLAGESVAGVRYEVVRRLLDAEPGALLRVTYARDMQPPKAVTLTAELLL